MTKKSYKLFDLTLLTVIAIIIEGILVFTSNQVKFMVEGFSVSFVVLFSLIGMFRWNVLGVVPGIGAAIVGMIFQNSFVKDAYSPISMIGCIVGILSNLLLVLYLKKVTKTKIKENFILLIIYAVSGYCLFILFYSLTWGLFDRNLSLKNVFNLVLSRNLLNLFMSTIVLLIANKVKDFLVDMDEYLIRLKSVPESARIRKEINEDNGQSLISEVVSSKEINDIALLDGGTLSEEQLIELNKTFKEKEGDNYGTRKS